MAASQRARMLEAVAQAVASKGYAATTVADVIELAVVSRRTFYEQFRDLEACFLAAYDTGQETLRAKIDEALRSLPRTDWRTRARVAIEAYLRSLATQPAAAWVFTCEVFAAGPKALKRRTEVLHRWIAMWRRLQELARQQDPSFPPLKDEQLLILVGGIEELVRECLRVHGAKHLPELAQAASAVAIATLAGEVSR